MQAQLSGTYKGIKANFQSLLKRFDEKILEYGQRGRMQQENPSVNLTENLNKLKLERAKVKAAFMDIRIMTEGQVLDLKDQYDKDYQNAYRVLGDYK